MADRDPGAGSGHVLVMSRRVDAARERVFDAFTDRAHIGQWWGPNGFSTTTEAMDVRVGGEWRFTMHGAAGTDYPNVIEYTRIEHPGLLCYDHGAGEGALFSAQVSFVEQDGGTGVTLSLICRSAQQLEEMKKDGAEEGGNQTLERLDRYLQGFGSEM
jgi:uncharacterized protein YndB with AHSA1/START domain